MSPLTRIFRAVAVIGLASISSAALAAEVATTIEQVPRRTHAAAASAPPQIAAPSTDRTSVRQLPGDMAERPSARIGEPLHAPAPGRAAPDRAALTAPSRSSGSVDAEEIARLLDSGEASSIDAAAAIASGVASPVQPAGQDDPIEDAAIRRALAAEFARAGR